MTEWPKTIDANNEYGGAKLRRVQGKTALYHDTVHKVYVVYREGWIFEAEEKRKADAMTFMDTAEKDYFNDENHPNPRDQPAGTAVYEEVAGIDPLTNEEETVTVVLSWTKYSANSGLFNAIKTEWFFDDENEAVYLQWVSVHSVSSWDDGFTDPVAIVPDSHKRIIRDLARDKYGNQRFRRLNLFLHSE